MGNSWRWTAARSIGTSHVKSGLPCQDFALCKEINSLFGSVFAAVISDGAGTANHAQMGAKMVCAGFLRAVLSHFATGKTIEDIGEDDVLEWVDGIRERINAFSRRRNAIPRDCAATLVGLIVGPRSAIVVHIGDGAAVVKEEGKANWFVPSWPFHGEYASTTAFVTDDPAPQISIVSLQIRLDRVVVFSDGLERLVLDHAKRMAHGPFFDRITAPVAASVIQGHDAHLAEPLRNYLDSNVVCERTDDDKSIILGVRI